MLKLRLSRGGTKKRPVYKIVVADSRFARDGRFIEKLGFYNPLLPKEKEDRIGLQLDRVKYWLSQGAQPTTRVARILGENQIIDMPVSFFIDPDMANDPNLDGVTTITLSYTFFKSQVQSGTAPTSEKKAG